MCPHHWSIHDPLSCIWSFLITVSSVHWTFLVAQMVKNPPANAGNPGLDPWVRKILWRRKWQPTPVFLPGEFHEQRSLTGHSPWSHRVRHDWATNRLSRDWAIYRFLLLCLTLPVIFTPRAELPSIRWQAAVNHTAGLQVPALRGPVFFYCMFPSSDIQRFCHSSENLLCAPWTQKLSFGRTGLNLTCGRGEAWT